MAKTTDLLSTMDRQCLKVAKRRGQLDAVIVVEGEPDRDGVMMRDHCEAMVERRLLDRRGQHGSKSRLRSARLIATYEPTPAGLALLKAVERLERRP